MKAQVNLQQGLVAYYPFNGNANDESGNGNNGTVNGATLTTDRFGKQNCAYFFDGSSSDITINFNPNLLPTGTNTMTYCFWIKSNSNNSGCAIISNGNVDLSNGCFVIRLYNTDTLAYLLNSYWNYGGGDPDTYTDLGNNIINNQFHFFVVTFVNSTCQVYLDGQSIISKNWNYAMKPFDSNFPIWLGKSYNSSANGYDGYFTGIIDDFRIYNRALNNGEIQDLYTEYTFNISFSDQSVKAGSIFEIPINTNALTTNDNIISYQLDYNYDNTKLQYMGNSIVGTLAENGSLQINSTNGKISVAWARQTPIIGTGSIIKLQFKSLDDGTTTPTITNCLFNTDTVRNVSNGMIISTIKYGDIDGNNYVQAYDAALAIQHSVNLDPIPNIDTIPWETWRVKAADVDGQNEVTAYDASLILQYTVGLINVFPAGKKSVTKDNANITITNENGFLVFRSTGDLFGLNVFVNENKQYLGTPQFLNSNILSATNITTTSYAIGAATAYSPTSGDIFMKIPYTAGQNVNVTFDMIVNSTNLQVTIGLVTGITLINENAIIVYPNPANNNLFVNGLTENSNVKIYDLTGKLIYNKKVSNNQIDIRNFQSGIYTMKIETAKGIVTKKFVKQ